MPNYRLKSNSGNQAIYFENKNGSLFERNDFIRTVITFPWDNVKCHFKNNRLYIKSMGTKHFQNLKFYTDTNTFHFMDTQVEGNVFYVVKINGWTEKGQHIVFQWKVFKSCPKLLHCIAYRLKS